MDMFDAMERWIEKGWKEIMRLKTPLMLLLFWLIYWGVSESMNTISLITGFLAVSMILAHISGKELFRKYKWDVGAKLNQAWERNDTPRAILAVGMLAARVLIYVAIVVSMAILVATLLGGRASAAIPTPDKLAILQKEHQRIWPEADIYEIAGQIKAESNWKERATRTEKSGVTSYGALQVLDQTFGALQEEHKSLAGLQPVDMLQFRWGVRAGLLYDRQMWGLSSFAVDRRERWAFALASYNGGYGWILRDRKLTAAAGQDKNRWYGHVERFSKRSSWAFRINREYPLNISSYADQYRKARLFEEEAA